MTSSNNSTGSAADLNSVVFDLDSINGSPVDKQPYLILSWVADIIRALQALPEINGDHQTFVTLQFEELFKYADKSKEPPVLAKGLRLQLAKAYKMIYNEASEFKHVYETVNSLISTVNRAKADKYSDLKQ